MKRFASAIAIVFAIHLTACNSAHPPRIGSPAPDFSLTDSDHTVSLSQLRGKPVILNFWASWCGPCRQMTPIIDQLADEYAGKAKVGKLNVDDNGQTAMRYQVRGIPTLLLFKGGQLVATKVGATGKGDVQKMLDAHIA